MDFNNIGTIVLVTLILISVSICYIIYILYNETITIKTQVSKLSSDNDSFSKKVLELEEKVNSYEEIEESESSEYEENDEEGTENE